MTAHAEEVTLVCNYQYIGPSLHDPAGEVVDMSARITINLDSGRVRGYESAWKNGGNVKAIVDSSTIRIIDVSYDGARTAVFAVSPCSQFRELMELSMAELSGGSMKANARCRNGGLLVLHLLRRFLVDPGYEKILCIRQTWAPVGPHSL
jgi:hypothetical protein